MNSGPTLAFILLGGPLAWLGQLIVSYMLASHACYPHVSPENLPMTGGLPPVLAIMSGSALLVAGLAFAAAWRLSVTARGEDSRRRLTISADRNRFLAIVGLIVNSLFAAGCLFALTADRLIPPCG